MSPTVRNRCSKLMIRLVRAELLKYRTLRSYWVLMASGAVIALLVIILFLYMAHMSVTNSAPAFAGSGSGIGVTSYGAHGWYPFILYQVYNYSQVFGVVLGIICVTGEYRYSTASFTYLVEPQRVRVLEAKLVASVIWGLFYGVLVSIFLTAVGVLFSAVWNLDPGAFLRNALIYLPEDLAGFVLLVLIGVGIGSLIHNQVLAIISGVGFFTVGTVLIALLYTIVPHIVPYMPQTALMALERVPSDASGMGAKVSLLPWWGGGIVLLGYTILFSGIGAMTVLKSDI